MTVRELITELEHAPDDLPVFVAEHPATDHVHLVRMVSIGAYCAEQAVFVTGHPEWVG